MRLRNREEMMKTDGAKMHISKGTDSLGEAVVPADQGAPSLPQHHSRRVILKSSALALVPLGIPSATYALVNQRLMTANGGTAPYPIPWLDKFGSHNQAAGLNNEPSHIYHFKGRVVRCNNFTGMGTDNQGNRIAFGAPSTDYGVMQGEYWAARTAQNGTFVHI
jgi:hypothetical protein